MNIFKTKIILFFISSCLFLLGMEKEAYAYLDPGTAGFLIQLLIGGIVAVSITTKMYWQNLKLFFTRNKQQIDNENKPYSEVEENKVEENKSVNDK